MEKFSDQSKSEQMKILALALFTGSESLANSKFAEAAWTFSKGDMNLEILAGISTCGLLYNIQPFSAHVFPCVASFEPLVDICPYISISTTKRANPIKIQSFMNPISVVTAGPTRSMDKCIQCSNMYPHLCARKGGSESGSTHICGFCNSRNFEGKLIKHIANHQTVCG